MPSTLLRRSLIAFALMFAAVPSAAQAANTFTVDSTVDTPDASLTDGRCRTADGTCSLRAAIQQANATVNQPDGPDRIVLASARRPSGRTTVTGASSSTSTLV